VKCKNEGESCINSKECVAHNTGKCGVDVPNQVICKNGKCKGTWY
jgi:hypothetical protein